MYAIQQQDALNFLLSGKAIVTFRNDKTSNRFTYRIVKKQYHGKRPLYFVSVLTSPKMYQFLGTIFDGVTYVHGKKSKISRNAQSAKVFSFVFNQLTLRKLDYRISIHHEGKCGRCGRSLTTPESIKAGYGPFCIDALSRGL